MTQPDIPKLPGGSLLGGHLSDYRERPIDLMTRVAAHGDLVAIRMGLFDVPIVSSPALVQQALVDHEADFVKSYGLSLFARPLLGDGLLTSEHDKHRRQRRLLAPVFVNKRIAGFAEKMLASAEHGLARMVARESVELSQETMQTTLEIVAKTLFDAEVGDASEVGDALTDAMEAIVGSLTANVPIPPPIPTRRNRRLRSATARLDRVIYAIIEERKRSGKDHGDMLSLLLAARDEDDHTGMSERQVRDEAMTAFLAGHETTANALAWTLYLLAKHPEALAEVEAELDEVLAGRAPGYGDLPRLPATLRALKEGMRLYPPAFLLGRRALRDVELGGYTVRKGRVIFVNVHGIHRRPDTYPEPDSFRPERFGKEREAALPRHAYMPFGAGNRMCIGNHFAWMEGHLVLASWLSRARFTLAHPDRPVLLDPLMTLRPRPPLTMRVELRQPATGIVSRAI